MGMTATQKILAYKSQKEKVSPKELVFASVDIALGNDITAPIAIDTLKDIGIKKVFDKTMELI